VNLLNHNNTAVINTTAGTITTIAIAPHSHHQNIKRPPSQSLIFMRVSIMHVSILVGDNKMTPYFSEDLVSWGGGLY